MSPAEPRREMTREEYLEFELTANVRHEFYRGEVFAMSGGSATHSRLQVRLLSIVERSSQAGGCTPYSADMRVKVESTGLYTYPDASVACGEPRFETAAKHSLLNPRAIFEVLSESTEAYDRGTKFAHYIKLDSLQEYVLISQVRRRVEVFTRRDETGWAFQYYEQDDDLIELPSISCSFRIAELYDGIELNSSQEIPREID